jgi:glycosyltransferase involved in cell wall biosynthesis
MAEAAQNAGYEYHVVCVMEEGERKCEVYQGVHIHRISMNRRIGGSLVAMMFSWIVFTILAMAKVGRLQFKYKFNVIHVHNIPDFLVFAALVPKLLGARVILGIQDVTPELMAVKSKGRFRRLSFRLATLQECICAAFADHVLTVGWPFEELLLQRGVPQKKLSSILNSADPKLFAAQKRTEPFLGKPTAERPLIFMYHGTLAARNGLDIAIRALAEAREQAPYLRLHIKGRDECSPSLTHLAQELGVGDQVCTFPPSSSDELVDFVASGDIGIIPYRSDGFMDLVLPTKAYEFALMRRPFIAANTPAMRSLFRAESTILCEPCNVSDFASAIVDVYQHPEKRLQLVTNAEQDYAPYRWELMAERYQQLLAFLAGSDDKQKQSDESYRVTLCNPATPAASSTY